MITIGLLNIYWFGAQHLHFVPFEREPADDERLSQLISQLHADVFVFIEIVDIERFQQVLSRVGPGWTISDANGEVVASSKPHLPQGQRVVVAWNRDSIELVSWSVLADGQPRTPVVARLRDRQTATEWTLVAVHPLSGDPRWEENHVPEEVAKANARKALFATVATWLSQPDAGFDGPLAMVVGDFNSLGNSPEVSPLVTGSLTGWRVLDAAIRPEGAGLFTTKTDSVVIDHIVLSPAFLPLVIAPPEIYAFDQDPAFPDIEPSSSVVWKRLTDHRPVRLSLDFSRAAVERTGAPTTDPVGPARFALLSRSALTIDEPSGVASLGDGLALVVDDRLGIYLLSPDGGAQLLRGPSDHPSLGDLECICLSEDGATAYTVSEGLGEVLAFQVTRQGGSVSLAEPRLLGVLPRPGSHANKGWEGSAVLPASRNPAGCEALIVAHEGAPKAIAVYSLPTLERTALVNIEGPIGDLLSDFSDVAVCPATGHLFLLSDQSTRLVEVQWTPGDQQMKLLGHFDLPVIDNAKPEGVCFESANRLLVVTDRGRELLTFSVER